MSELENAKVPLLSLSEIQHRLRAMPGGKRRKFLIYARATNYLITKNLSNLEHVRLSRCFHLLDQGDLAYVTEGRKADFKRMRNPLSDTGADGKQVVGYLSIGANGANVIFGRR